MEHCLENRIPDNSVLSHDLLEGIHGRVGLVTDLILLEQFPPTSLSWMRRLHRWVRGDWQLLPWLSPWPRRADERRKVNDLAPIHLWKIFDNLRRSLLPPAALILFADGISRLFCRATPCYGLWSFPRCWQLRFFPICCLWSHAPPIDRLRLPACC